MRVDFPYPGYEQIAPVDVPDANLMGVFSPRSYDHVDEKAVLSGGFERPGGAKLAFPGVAGKEIMARNQWEASMHMSETVMGVPENPMRLRMEEAARMAGFNYIVNVVYDASPRHTIVGCFVGDVVAAHRQ